MRGHRALVLAAAALTSLIGVGAYFVTPDDFPASRTLRGPQSVEKVSKLDEGDGPTHDEDRGLNLPAVDTLTNAIQSTVTNGQLNVWIKKGESTDDVFKLLTLDQAADDLLASPQLQSWLNYMKMFNKENPDKKTSLIATLTAHYGDEALSKIVTAAKQVPDTARIAKRVQSEQLQHWVTAEKSPDDVFAVMKLDDVGADLFAHPEFTTWTKYLEAFNEIYTGRQTSVFAILKTHYDEEVLVQILATAKKLPSTETLASQVQAELTKLWLHDRRSPADIFTLLQLDKEGKKALFANPQFSTWMRYTDDYNMVDPKAKVTTISTLKKHWEEDELAKVIIAARRTPGIATISKRLEAEQLRDWYSNLKPPEYVLTALKLDKTGSKLLEKPLFAVWKRYVEFISAMDPSIKVNLLKPLTKVYGERKVSKILVAASSVPSTKKFAADLQAAQLDHWLADKKDPAKVFSLLRVEGSAVDAANRALYDKYEKAYNLLQK